MAKNNPPIKQKYVETPERMWQLFCEYVEHEKNNPMLKREYVGKDGEPVDTKLQVPITFEGFECYVADLGIIQDLGDYSNEKNESYKTYRPIVTRIRNNCFSQNFKGAAVGLFNSSLIAKKLGLTDKQEVKLHSSVNILNIDPLDASNDNKVG